MSKAKELLLSIGLSIVILTLLATKGSAIAEGHWWMKMLLAPFTETAESSVINDNHRNGGIYYVYR